MSYEQLRSLISERRKLVDRDRDPVRRQIVHRQRQAVRKRERLMKLLRDKKTHQ